MRAFRTAVTQLMDALGEPCTLERNNGEVVDGLKVSISRDLEFQGQQSETSERAHQAEMDAASVGQLKRKDRIITATQAWQVERPVANDGYTIKVIVSEVD